MKVRRLTKVVENREALGLLETKGFDAAEALLGKVDPREQELYATLEKTSNRLQQITMTEMVELAGSADRLVIFRDLRHQIEAVISTVEQYVLNSSDRHATSERPIEHA
jgi:hypothetical protein